MNYLSVNKKKKIVLINFWFEWLMLDRFFLISLIIWAWPASHHRRSSLRSHPALQHNLFIFQRSHLSTTIFSITEEILALSKRKKKRMLFVQCKETLLVLRCCAFGFRCQKRVLSRRRMRCMTPLWGTSAQEKTYKGRSFHLFPFFISLHFSGGDRMFGLAAPCPMT